jgi:hypothetical protein
MAPEHEAPELMGYDEVGGGCYFRRQPATAEELEHAINAVRVACCGAVHYGGVNPNVLKRLTAPAESRSPWWRFWAR